MEPDVQPELGSRQEQGIFHGERSLIELVKWSMDEAARSPIPAPGHAGDVKRGKLKVFLGAFPGAGKTNAMLTAAQRMRDAGRDVVAGVVDTHESVDRILLDGFESLPPPVVNGAPVSGELDLDAALRRHPEVILVD